MKPYAGVVNWVVRTFFGIICRLDTAELKKVPAKGPLILVGNHVNFLEVPVLRSTLHPRDLIGLTKVESYDNPLLKFLFDTWGAFLLNEEPSTGAHCKPAAMHLAAKMLVVAPEGTRSGDGKLLPGKTGVVPLAVRSGVPILPVSCWGAEHLRDNIKHFRRTPFHVRVGGLFIIDTHGEGMSKEVRQRITDEIMFKLAEMLPDQYHGAYPHPEREVYQYLRDA